MKEEKVGILQPSCRVSVADNWDKVRSMVKRLPAQIKDRDPHKAIST